MKKFFSFLVLGMALCLFPLTASALTKGANIKCNNEECVDNGDTCQRTCDIMVTGDADYTIKDFAGTISFENTAVTLTKVTAGTGWTLLSNNSTSIQLTATDSTNGVAIKANQYTTVATITIDIPKAVDGKDVDCTVSLTSADFPTAQVQVTTETTTTVKTGVTLPLAIIGCGIVVAGVVYFVSKKNTKMYKI